MVSFGLLISRMPTIAMLMNLVKQKIINLWYTYLVVNAQNVHYFFLLKTNCSWFHDSEKQKQKKKNKTKQISLTVQSFTFQVVNRWPSWGFWIWKYVNQSLEPGWMARDDVRTHPFTSKQWAAVKTNRLLINVPPQKVSNFEFDCRMPSWT